MTTTKNWYYLIDLTSNIVIDYNQLPETWGNITGLSDATGNQLQNMNWAGHNVGFFSKEQALTLVTQEQLDVVMPLAIEVAKELLREKRNLLLTESDKVVTIDRWESYDADTKGRIGAYRQSLRDITEQPDIFNIVWPIIPPELGYLIDFV